MIHMVLKRYGTSQQKKRIWDTEFGDGKWDFLERKPPDLTSRDPVYNYIYKYCRKRNILDLGCGTGKTGFEMDLDKYYLYTGVDVSNLAIERASSRCKTLEGRKEKNKYFAEDIVSYIPQREYAVILFRESIYYVRKLYIKEMLVRYAAYLDGDGVFIVRICDQKKYNHLIKLIDRNFRIIERFIENNSGMIILVFK
jgi:SAM-dependent methyltransferase